MSLLYSAEQVRELDRVTIEEEGIPRITLMKRAGQACVDALLERWPNPGFVAVLCGSGNNAGDGFIIAGLLRAKGIRVTVGLVGREPLKGTDAASAYHFCRDNGVEIGTAESAIEDAELIVDALLGTGVTGEVREDYANVIRSINGGGLPVLAVDLPSGLSADSGVCLGECVRADLTVTFIGRKFGLMTCDGPEYTGEIRFSDLDVPDVVYRQVSSTADVLDYEGLIPSLEPRHRNAHKLDHGHVLIVGGDTGMGGAVAMAAEAALLSGAGMVSVATRSENVTAIISRRPEVMARGLDSAAGLATLINRATIAVVGPGLGRSDWSKEMFAAITSAELPMVVDADGLNLLAEEPFQNDDWVLTPHPGEAGRLLNSEGSIQVDRLSSALELQKRYGGSVVLKGAGTLIVDGEKVSVCPYGNPGMSVSGMGDVLAGTIGGLRAQGLDGGDAARLGAVVHSLAADRKVSSQGERGLLATELLKGIRRLVNR